LFSLAGCHRNSGSPRNRLAVGVSAFCWVAVFVSEAAL